MTLEGLLDLTRRSIRILALVVVSCALVSAAAALLSPVTYTASAVAYLRVNVLQDPPQDPDSYYAATQMASRKIEAIIPVFTSEAVGQRVVDSLSLDASASQTVQSLSAEHTPETVTVKVSATASSADEAQRIADEAVLQAAAEVEELEGEGSPVEIVLMTPARLSAATRAPQLLTYLGAGLLAGLVLGYSWILLRAALDKSLRGAKEVREAVAAPLLAVLPLSASMRRHGRTRATDPMDPEVEEQLRRLRTALCSAQDGPGALVITSPGGGQGTSSIALGLARLTAISGRRVILIDANLRTPVLGGDLGLEPDHPGLRQLLDGSARLEEALVRTRLPGLLLIPAGGTPSNPSELLGSAAMAELLKRLSAEHLLIIDAPPALPFTDAAVLSRRASGTLVVIEAGSATAQEVDETAIAVEQAGGSVLGVVLNRAASPWRRRR